MGVDKFELEQRYIVLKRKDLSYLTSSQRLTLEDIGNLHNMKREAEDRRPELSCVVIESDWPEYAEVVAMLRKRIEASNAL